MCVHIYVYIPTHTYIYMYMYVCMYVYIYSHINTYMVTLDTSLSRTRFPHSVWVCRLYAIALYLGRLQNLNQPRPTAYWISHHFCRRKYRRCEWVRGTSARAPQLAYESLLVVGRIVKDVILSVLSLVLCLVAARPTLRLWLYSGDTLRCLLHPVTPPSSIS